VRLNAKKTAGFSPAEPAICQAGVLQRHQRAN
jgi:hypothetical protein